MIWLNKQPAPIKKSRSNFAYDSPSWDVNNGLRISTKTRLRVFIWWYPKVNIQTIVFLNIDEVETSVIVKIAKRLKHGYGQELQALKATRERTLIPSVFFCKSSQVKSNQVAFLCVPGKWKNSWSNRTECSITERDNHGLRERHNANHIVWK